MQGQKQKSGNMNSARQGKGRQATVGERTIELPESEVRGMLDVIVEDEDHKLYQRVMRGQAINQLAGRLSDRLQSSEQSTGKESENQSGEKNVQDDSEEPEMPDDENDDEGKGKELPDGY